MKVFKFGGASVKDATSIKNLANILKKYPEEQILVVISAMGKTTNALEKIVDTFFYQKENIEFQIITIEKYHINILNNLFPDPKLKIFNEIKNIFRELKKYLQGKPSYNYDFEYDQIIYYGELISSRILSFYLSEVGFENTLFDARKLIRTDFTYREGKVDWELTQKQIRTQVGSYFQKEGGEQKLAVTQGFIGSAPDKHPITLGREGSDFTSAIFAWSLDAEEVVIWKDVPGLMNADPKLFADTRKLEKISYKEAIELAYYGATVLHPKTIQPLQNKNIPLWIKSFAAPEAEGTLIQSLTDTDNKISSCILKFNQLLISISARDFSFITEKNLHGLFGVFASHGIKVNMMQNSAISFSVCIDNSGNKIPAMLEELQTEYSVRYNDNLELITVRHYNQAAINRVVGNKKVLLEQKSRSTVQLVVVP